MASSLLTFPLSTERNPMTNPELHVLIAKTADEIVRLQAVVEAAKRERMSDPTADRNGNLTAQSGCDRCDCGCKYWEFDRCIDCGKMHEPAHPHCE